MQRARCPLSQSAQTACAYPLSEASRASGLNAGCAPALPSLSLRLCVSALKTISTGKMPIVPVGFPYNGCELSLFHLPFSSMRLLITRSLLTTLVSLSFSPFCVVFCVGFVFPAAHAAEMSRQKKPPGETARRHEKSPSGDVPEGPMHESMKYDIIRR